MSPDSHNDWIPPYVNAKLGLLSNQRERALELLAEKAFKAATVQLDTLLKRFASPPPPDEIDRFYSLAIPFLCDEVMRPLLEQLWEAVEKCLEADDRTLVCGDEDMLYKFGHTWAETVGAWIGDHLLTRMSGLSAPEQIKRGQHVLSIMMEGLVDRTFSEAFWSYVEIALCLNAPKPADTRDPPSSLISMAVAVKTFDVSRTTLQRAITSGKITSWRGSDVPENRTHQLSEAELAQHYTRWPS